MSLPFYLSLSWGPIHLLCCCETLKQCNVPSLIHFVRENVWNAYAFWGEQTGDWCALHPLCGKRKRGKREKRMKRQQKREEWPEVKRMTCVRFVVFFPSFYIFCIPSFSIISQATLSRPDLNQYTTTDIYVNVYTLTHITSNGVYCEDIKHSHTAWIRVGFISRWKVSVYIRVCM